MITRSKNWFVIVFSYLEVILFLKRWENFADFFIWRDYFISSTSLTFSFLLILLRKNENTNFQNVLSVKWEMFCFSLELLFLNLTICLIYFFAFCMYARLVWVSGKLPPGKFPPIKLPLGKFPPGKFPPRKSPPGIFPPMFLNIPTGVFYFFVFFYFCHRHHWYYLKDCFVILCFKSAEVRNSEVNASKKL